MLVEGYLWERCIREFVEAFVRLVGNQRSNASDVHVAGTIALDVSGHLNEPYWQRLESMLALTERCLTNTWVGFSWIGECEAQCELQRDDGEDGGLVRIRVQVPNEWAPRVEALLTELAPLSELRLSIRATNCLESDGIAMVRELCRRTADELLKIRNLNEATLKEICEKLAARGLRLQQD